MSALWVDGAVVPAAGDLVQFGEQGSESVELVVKSITPGPDLSARLTAVDHAPAIFTAATQQIPDFDPQITAPPGELQPVIDTIRSDETVLFRDDDGSLKPRILIAFALAANRAYHGLLDIQGQIRPNTADSQYRLLPALDPYATEATIADVQSGETYELRLRYHYRNRPNKPGPWTTLIHTVIGTTTLPPDVLQFWRQGTRLLWLYPNPPRDFAGFELREHGGINSTWSTARKVHEALLATAQFDIDQTERAQKTYLVKARDTAANESATAKALTVVIGDAVVGDDLVENLVFTRDYALEGFPGTITNGTVVGLELHATDTGALFWGAATARFWDPDNAALFWDVIYQPLVYETTFVPDLFDIESGVALREPTIVLDTILVGDDARLSYQPGDTNLYWAEVASNPFWGADTALFWPASGGEWVAWPGTLAGPARQAYPLRAEMLGGPRQGKVTRFKALIDVPDLSETFADFAVAAVGTRLPVTETFIAIKNVSLTLKDDGGTAVSVRWADKLATGPLLIARDAAGVATTATLDARLQGY